MSKHGDNQTKQNGNQNKRGGQNGQGSGDLLAKQAAEKEAAEKAEAEAKASAEADAKAASELAATERAEKEAAVAKAKADEEVALKAKEVSDTPCSYRPLIDVCNRYEKAFGMTETVILQKYKESVIIAFVTMMNAPATTTDDVQYFVDKLKNRKEYTELALMRGIFRNEDYYHVVSYTHAKIKGLKITVEPPYGNSNKL